METAVWKQLVTADAVTSTTGATALDKSCYKFHKKICIEICIVFSNLLRQFSKNDIWRLQKEAWKLNYIMGLMRCKILNCLLKYKFFS